jgi:NAD(P)-dependent dehydrogenase (short-subunit alcohol dehydrogenase family)
MSTQQTILLVGGTGRTGRRVLEQLLERGMYVRAIVRSARKLPAGATENPNLTVIEADLLALGDEDLQRHIRGCDAVISCLGHVISLKGIFGPPRDLVTRAMQRIYEAIKTLQPAKPVKFILMSSVSVNHPGGLDTRRGKVEKAFLGIIRSLIPPARDNQLAANFLYNQIGTAHPFVQWTVVRPDELREGGVSEYALYENLVSSLFKPDSTNMANVAHFMCELAVNPKLWNVWQGKLPVIINAIVSNG